MTPEPSVSLSADGLSLTVVTVVDGIYRTATYERSPDVGPFDDEAIAKAVAFATKPSAGGLAGQRSVTRRLGERAVLHAAFGPPTWWWPRVVVKRDEVMVGWLRAAVAVWWYR